MEPPVFQWPLVFSSPSLFDLIVKSAGRPSRGLLGSMCSLLSQTKTWLIKNCKPTHAHTAHSFPQFVRPKITRFHGCGPHVEHSVHAAEFHFFYFHFLISIFFFLFAGLLKKWDIVRKTAWEHCYGCVWMHGHTRTNMKDWNVRQHRKLQVVRFLTNRQCWWWQRRQGAPAWSSAAAAEVNGDFFFFFSASKWRTWKEKLRRVFNRQKSLKTESVQYVKRKERSSSCQWLNGNLVKAIDASLLNEIEVNLPFGEFSPPPN